MPGLQHEAVSMTIATGPGHTRQRLRCAKGHGTRRAHLSRGVDFAAIDRAALPRLPELCRRWLPGGRRVGAEYVCASLHGGGRGASCKVLLYGAKAGVFRDFATGEGGRGAVALACAVFRLRPREAAAQLAAALGLRASEAA
jgi:hypothetical protein